MSIISSFYEICKMVEQENIEIDLLQYFYVISIFQDNVGDKVRNFNFIS
jgi:hypothetical protein